MSRPVISRLLVLVGVALLGWWAVHLAGVAHFQHEQTVTFTHRPALNGTNAAPPRAAVPSAIIVPPHGVIGKLEIPRLQLSVIVMEGDDEQTLEHAVGHLPDTVMPWDSGNSALAGHRDTFFRPLRKLEKGDEIRLTTPDGPLAYRVSDIHITTPDDVSVLAPTPGSVLTLVTCYPFYYIGSAPKRYIVRAERVPVESAAQRPSGRSGG